MLSALADLEWHRDIINVFGWGIIQLGRDLESSKWMKGRRTKVLFANVIIVKPSEQQKGFDAFN